MTGYPDGQRRHRRPVSTPTGLTSDPYRGLEYSILKNKNPKLFPTTGNITGVKGAGMPGLDKMNGFYSDFFEADAYRDANGGLGLPFLSTGDIALATQWNLTGQRDDIAECGGNSHRGPVAGLHPFRHVSKTYQQCNACQGRVDGNGTFTGITTINAGTRLTDIIGTPNIGFVMQLGSDAGNSITLSGTNTYTGGTSILAGNLIVAGDAWLGAAVPAGAAVDPSHVRASVQAANGIIFNSLTKATAL